MRSGFWTDERIALLTKLHDEGLSASRIAAAIGDGVTRNAVIGKIHRLGLKQDAAAEDEPALSAVVQPIASAREDRRQFRDFEERLSTKTATPTPLPAPAPAPIPAPARAPAPRPETTPVVIPVTTRVTIVDLRDSMCHWPLGDPRSDAFRYCGAALQPVLATMPRGGKKPAQSPYCPEHSELAHDRGTPSERRAHQIPAAA